MAITPLTVTIDLNPSYKKIPAVYVSQLDNNLRELAITLQDGGVNYDVASSGYDVYIEGTKPDYKGFSYDVTDIGGTIVGSVITVPMQTQMTCVKGMVSTEIVLKSGSDRIGSANFLLVVERAGLDEDTDVSETDIPGYIDGAQRAAEAAEQAKDDAVDAKNTAVAVAASIPEDYTTLSNDVDDLKSAFEQLPTSIQPDMSVGNVFSDDSYTSDRTPYLYRVSGGGVEVGKVEADEIVGGSVAWNQYAKAFVTGNYIVQGSGSSLAFENGVATLDVTANYNRFVMTPTVSNNAHKLLVSCEMNTDYEGSFMWGVWSSNSTNTSVARAVKTVTTLNTWLTIATVGILDGGTDNKIAFQSNSGTGTVKARNGLVIDLTQMFGTTIADYIYSLEQATAGAGVALFRKMFPNAYYPYNAGELMHVSGVSEHVMSGKNLVDTSDVTDGYIDNLGEFHTNTTWSTSALIPIDGSKPYILSGLVDYPNTDTDNFRTYDIGQSYLGRVGVSASSGYPYTFGSNVAYVQFCWKKSDDSTVMFAQESTHTDYEPYEKHTYPLDSSLTLRGIPKLSDGQIYYDGDTYASDGTVTRKYGIVDLGTLAWGRSGVRFYSQINVNSSAIPVPALFNTTAVANIISTKYPATDRNTIENYDKVCSLHGDANARYITVVDSAYSDASAFKNAMSGVYLVYELATPTTETAEPYEEYQHVTNGGTEEYVSTGIVPVGHITKYPTDIVAKVDGLPSDFSTLIASTEKGFTASKAYSANQFMIINNQLYKATASIANGATITVGTNVTATTIADILTSLLNA